MANIVLDTNIIVSAMLSPKGNENEVLRFAFTSFANFYYSDEIFAEYKRVLNYPKFDKYYGQEDISLILQTIEKRAKKIVPSRGSITLIDETDRCFYDAAASCGSYLLTGNLKHFPNETFIMNAKTFLERKHKLEL